MKIKKYVVLDSFKIGENVLYPKVRLNVSKELQKYHITYYWDDKVWEMLLTQKEFQMLVDNSKITEWDFDE